MRFAAEIKIRAERKAGEILAGMELDAGGRPAETSCTTQQVYDAPTLSELGVERTQSHRWQRVASIPEQAFEDSREEVNSPFETAGAGAYC
jgi:hypothetical protein